jgi:hypothetical protein
LAKTNFLSACDEQDCSYTSGAKEYCLKTVKKSNLLDEMARKVAAEARRIEAARHEAHRLIQRRRVELAEIAAKKLKAKAASVSAAT